MPTLLATVRKYYTCVARTFFLIYECHHKLCTAKVLTNFRIDLFGKLNVIPNSNLPRLRFFLYCICIIVWHSHLNAMQMSLNWVQHWVSQIGLFLKALYFSGFLCLYITILWPEAERKQKNKKTIIIGKGKCRMQSVQPETSHFAPITWPPIFESFSMLQI